MPKLPVDVLWIARYDYDEGWELKRHHHKYLQMILFLDGRGVFTLSGEQFPIRAGELFLIPAGEVHSLRAESLVRTLDVKFRVSSGDLAHRLSSLGPARPWNEPSLASRLERIRAEGEQKPLFYREMCSVLLSEFLYLYLRQGPRATPLEDSASATGTVGRDLVLERAMACIRARYQSELTVREIAPRETGCTDRTLSLHFQAAMQLRPLSYLQRYRITKAKALIQYSDYALKEIAEQVGFPDRASFHPPLYGDRRTQSGGMAPRIYRRDTQGRLY